MELKDLVGNHVMSGIETGYVKLVEEWRFCDTAQYVKFTLDGTTYRCVEDPDDGYRSYMGYLETLDESCAVKLPDINVICQMKPAERDEKLDVLQFIDVENNQLFLEIGTNYSYDWYPYCVMHYTPENLACNEGR